MLRRIPKIIGSTHLLLLYAAVGVVFPAGIIGIQAQELPTFPETELWDEYDPNLPYIVVIDTGGTISSGATSGVGGYGGEGPENGVRTILEDMLPEIGALANIKVVDLARNEYSISGSSSVSTEKHM